MAVELIRSSGRRTRRPKQKSAPAEPRLQVLLLEPPGKNRDGRRLRLELDGYEVTAFWEPESASGRIEAAFTYLVLSTAGEAQRWSWLTEKAEMEAPIVVIWPRSRADLEATGFKLRERDFCSRGASPLGSNH